LSSVSALWCDGQTVMWIDCLMRLSACGIIYHAPLHGGTKSAGAYSDGECMLYAAIEQQLWSCGDNVTRCPRLIYHASWHIQATGCNDLPCKGDGAATAGESCRRLVGPSVLPRCMLSRRRHYASRFSLSPVSDRSWCASCAVSVQCMHACMRLELIRLSCELDNQ
jgi:hypothetical protein